MRIYRFQKYRRVLATIVYYVVTRVGGLEKEEAYNKHALHLQEIWKKIFGELSTHVATINGCSKDCNNLGIL